MNVTIDDHVVYTTIILRDFSRYAGILANIRAKDSDKTGIAKWIFERCEKIRIEELREEFLQTSFKTHVDAAFSRTKLEHPAITLAQIAYR